MIDKSALHLAMNNKHFAPYLMKNINSDVQHSEEETDILTLNVYNWSMDHKMLLLWVNISRQISTTEKLSHSPSPHTQWDKGGGKEK